VIAEEWRRFKEKRKNYLNQRNSQLDVHENGGFIFFRGNPKFLLTKKKRYFSILKSEKVSFQAARGTKRAIPVIQNKEASVP
jgi:hypothetical protein